MPGNQLIESLARNQSTMTYVDSQSHAKYQIRRATHYWIHVHRLRSWSILTVDLLTRGTLTQAITQKDTTTRELGKLSKDRHRLNDINPTPPSLLCILEIDQWTPRSVIEQCQFATAHSDNRLFTLKHNTPMR